MYATQRTSSADDVTPIDERTMTSSSSTSSTSHCKTNSCKNENPTKHWKRVHDQKSGRHYYWDRITNRTTWQKPTAFSLTSMSSSDQAESSNEKLKTLSDISPNLSSTLSSKKNSHQQIHSHLSASAIDSSLSTSRTNNVCEGAAHEKTAVGSTSFRRRKSHHHVLATRDNREQWSASCRRSRRTSDSSSRCHSPTFLTSALSDDEQRHTHRNPIPSSILDSSGGSEFEPESKTVSNTAHRHTGLSSTNAIATHTCVSDKPMMAQTNTNDSRSDAVSMNSVSPSNTISRTTVTSARINAAMSSKTNTNVQHSAVISSRPSLTCMNDVLNSVSTLHFSEHRPNMLSRILRVGEEKQQQQQQQIKQDKIMSFQNSLIKKALLQSNRHLDKQSVQSFKNIMSYMEDRKSHKPPHLHVQKLLRTALLSSEALQDEMYLQVCKQVTKHTNIYHCLKGWDLLLIFLATFSPSPTILQYLKNFISDASNGQRNEDIQRRAMLCVDNIHKIMHLGHRVSAPSSHEVDAITKCEPIDIVVYLADDSSKLVQIDSYTLIKELRSTLAVKCSLSYSAPFNLFEVSPAGKQSVVDGDLRVLDVISKWNQGTCKSTSSASFSCSRENCINGASSCGSSRSELRQRTGVWRILYRAELVLHIDSPRIINDNMAIHLLYAQAVGDIVNGSYPYVMCVNDATLMAAWQLHATYGDYRHTVHTQSWVLCVLHTLFGDDECKQSHHLLPHIMLPLSQGNKEEHAACILAQYTKLQGTTIHHAKIAFIRIAQQSVLYGSTRFHVQQLHAKQRRQPLILAISVCGVALINPATYAILAHYTYEQLVTWGHTDERMILVVGNVVEQRKMYFKTLYGIDMNRLLGDFITTMVAGTREIY